MRTPKLSVAPMMERTDRHFRFLVRQISQRTLLYTEMVTTPALLKGPTERLLRYDPQEHPIALQLGGDNPEDLTQCALLAEDAGYDEVNINVGCPSDRVQTGRFGACLMAEPERVADAVSAMQNRVQIPVTVKHRIGIDDLDRYEDMLNFVDVVAQAGCWRFSVHARKAWLQGLSPKENRTVPPLRYEDVYRLKRERPALDIEINGGIKTLAEAQEHLQHVDAVMIGRAAYDDPYLFAEADNLVFGEHTVALDRQEVGAKMLAYAEQQISEGQRLHSITRHMMGLFTAVPGARAYRRHLSTHGVRPEATSDVLRQALALVPGY